ncbi:hypothetical protein ACFFON_15340 [Arthrobacter citreus]|uniref:hypothetical protein n=1 Tax=Arthrobacter TaxID=1663 RepID=UPI0012653077|nr:hypothetical protein [Arthrobacter gandavensis]
MILGAEAAPVVAQIFPVFLVLLAIEGRYISYGGLAKGWVAVAITVRWIAVSACFLGTIYALKVTGAGNEEDVNGTMVTINIFFYLAAVVLYLFFIAMQVEEVRAKTKDR